SMFSQRFAVPMPRHLLEPTYLEGKVKLFESPYWLGGFIGTGPYKLRTWTQGSGVLLQANESYVLGKPKIDTIEVKYITDPNTLISNLLAGSVDLTLGYGVSLESALLLKSQWTDGRVEMAPNGWIPIHPPFMNPRPSAVADAWQRLGVRVQQVVVSASGTAQDREINANFPAFRLIRQPNTTTEMNRYLISQTPTAETRFTGFNFTRYINPAYNELIVRYF